MRNVRIEIKCLCFIFTGCLMFFGITDAVATEGLIAHWAMERLENDAVKDISGNGHDAKFGSKVKDVKPEFVSGRAGNAMKFEQSKMMYLSVAKSEDFNIDKNITLMAWVKPSDNMRRRRGEILCNTLDNGERGKTWPGWRFECGWSMFEFRYLTVEDKYGAGRSPGGTVPAGSWTHIAVTFDGKTICLYVNAILKRTVPGKGDISSSEYPLIIGNYVGSKTPYAFDGLLDEIKVFNKVLTKDEIWEESLPKE